MLYELYTSSFLYAVCCCFVLFLFCFVFVSVYFSFSIHFSFHFFHIIITFFSVCAFNSKTYYDLSYKYVYVHEFIFFTLQMCFVAFALAKIHHFVSFKRPMYDCFDTVYYLHRVKIKFVKKVAFFCAPIFALVKNTSIFFFFRFEWISVNCEV